MLYKPDKQTNKQTNTYTHTHIYIYIGVGSTLATRHGPGGPKGLPGSTRHIPKVLEPCRRIKRSARPTQASVTLCCDQFRGRYDHCNQSIPTRLFNSISVDLLNLISLFVSIIVNSKLL